MEGAIPLTTKVVGILAHFFMIYKLFGFPVWYGKIKTKIAKRHLSPRIKFIMKKFTEFENMGIGSLVNDCTGFNGRVEELKPEYRRISHGSILEDISIRTLYGWCSMSDCGVEPGENISRETIEKKLLDFIEWYFVPKGDLSEKVLKEYTALKNGDHVVDEEGIQLKEFR